MDKKEVLIELVRKHRCLYDMSDKRYRFIEYKQKIWQTIARQMKMSCEDVRQKWKMLRDSYLKYHKQVQAYVPGSSQKIVAKYMYADQLAFLNETLRIKKPRDHNSIGMQGSPGYCFGSSSDLHFKNTQDEYNVSLHEPTSSVFQDHNHLVIKSEEVTTKSEELPAIWDYQVLSQTEARALPIEAASSDDAQTKLLTKDEFQVFGDFVASELRSLEKPESKRRLKIMIQKAILQIAEEEDKKV